MVVVEKGARGGKSSTTKTVCQSQVAVVRKVVVCKKVSGGKSGDGSGVRESKWWLK